MENPPLSPLFTGFYTSQDFPCKYGDPYKRQTKANQSNIVLHFKSLILQIWASQVTRHLQILEIFQRLWRFIFVHPKCPWQQKNKTPFSVQNLGWILVSTNSPWTDVNKDALIEGSRVPWSKTTQSKLLLGGFNSLSLSYFMVKLEPKNTQRGINTVGTQLGNQ